MGFPGKKAGLAGARLVLFRVGDLVFAVEAVSVREILPAHGATRIPGAVDAVEGLINVRGRLLTLVDARRALNHPPSGGGGPIILWDTGEQVVGFAVELFNCVTSIFLRIYPNTDRFLVKYLQGIQLDNPPQFFFKDSTIMRRVVWKVNFNTGLFVAGQDH